MGQRLYPQRQGVVGLASDGSARDVSAMEKVWSKDDTIQNVGPASKTPGVGWPSLKKGYEDTFNQFSEMKVLVADAHYKVNGDVAGVSGLEQA